MTFRVLGIVLASVLYLAALLVIIGLLFSPPGWWAVPYIIFNFVDAYAATRILLTALER